MLSRKCFIITAQSPGNETTVSQPGDQEGQGAGGIAIIAAGVAIVVIASVFVVSTWISINHERDCWQNIIESISWVVRCIVKNLKCFFPELCVDLLCVQFSL